MYIKGMDSDLYSDYQYVPLIVNTKQPARPYAKEGGLSYRDIVQRFPASQYQYALLLQTSDLVVVDVDTKNNPNAVSEFQTWLQQKGFEEAFKCALLVKTPSGGYHFYFRLPAKHKATKARWINALAHEGIHGIDVLSSGLVLLPGCKVHNQYYQMVGNSINPRATNLDDLPLLPEEFLDVLQIHIFDRDIQWNHEPRVTETDKQLKNAHLLDADKIERFLRSKHVRFRRQQNQFKLCCLYHDDKNPSASILVTEEKLFYYCFACSQENKGIYAEFVKEYMEWAAKQSYEGKKVLSLRELDAIVKTQPQRYCLWGDLLAEGTITVLGGYQKDFKSTLARNIAARISCGLPLAEWQTQEGKVLILSYEESADQFLPRIQTLRPCADNIYVIPRDDIENAFTVHTNGTDPLELLDVWCAMTQPRLLILDTGWNFFNQVLEYRRMTTLGNLEVNRVFDELKRIAHRHRLAILMIWHVRKNVELTGSNLEQTFQKMKDGLSGVRGLASAADSVWFLRRKRQADEESMPEVEFFAEGRHPRIYQKWTIDEMAGALVDSVWLEQQYQQPVRSQTLTAPKEETPAEPIIWVGEENDEPPVASEEHENRLDDSIAMDMDVEIDLDLEAIDASSEFVEYFEPMEWYEFQYYPTDKSVWLLEKPNDSSDTPYYTALCVGDRRKRGVYGHTLNCIKNRQGTYGDLPFDRPKRIVFDIETTHINPEVGRVCAIGVYQIDGEHKQLLSRVIMDRTDEEEKSLIEWFDRLLNDFVPDWLIGYNIFSFDLPYLEKRAEILGTQLTYLRRFYKQRRNVKFRYGSSYIETDIWVPTKNPRHAIVDLYLLTLRYDANSGGLLTSHKMYDVYYHITGEMIHIPEDKAQMEHWSEEAILDLVDSDVLIANAINDYLLPVEYQLAQYIYLPFGELIYAGQGSRMQHILIQDYLSRHRAIACKEKPRQDYEGAISRLEHVGIFRNLKKIDVASLYPSVIILHRIHPENDYDQRLPVILKTMRDERLQLKKQKDNPLAQMRQQALKILINSAYGFMGGSGFSFADWEAAAKVTEYGRQVLETMYQTIVEFGGVPIELDTDGIIFQDQANNADAILKYLHEHTPYQYDCDRYEVGIFIGTKNYILLDEHGKITYKGASIRSRKEPPLFRRFIDEVIDALLHEQPIEPIFRRYQQQVLTAEAHELIAVQKATEKTKSTDGTDLRIGDTVYVWYSNRRDGEQRTIRPPSAEELDRNRYLEKLVKVLERFEELEPVRSVLQNYYTRGQGVLEV